MILDGTDCHNGDQPLIAALMGRQVRRLVATWAEGPKEPGFLVTNCGHLTAHQIIRAYAPGFKLRSCLRTVKMAIAAAPLGAVSPARPMRSVMADLYVGLCLAVWYGE
ncbi:hypothetical protein TPY_1841 [Sulfobacillus acidophilus TPY]|nr:hypothetical protein TPY_1841 [Sulfobacillus acidophilus TPY]